MIGHDLLNRGSYVHPILPSVPPQLSLYVSFMLFVTSLSMFIPSICQCVIIFISSLFIFMSPTWSNPFRRRPYTPLKPATGRK